MSSHYTITHQPAAAPASPINDFSLDSLYELQHFAELGRISASLLHEISNPLTASMLHLELTEEKSPVISQLRRDIKLLRRYVDSARQQIRHCSTVSSFSVQTQLDQLKRILIPLARTSHVKLEIAQAPNCKLSGDPVKFQHLLANLIMNAIDAYSENGDFTQASLVRVTMFSSPRWLTVQVTDWGKGIPALELQHIFEPFYTTKNQSGRGLGIGLSIVRDYVINDFKGSIKVSSSRRRGTQFTVKLLLQPK